MGSSIRENKEQMAELYTRIANEVAYELPTDWTRMCVSLVADSSNEETFLVYYSVDSGKTYRDFMEESFEFDEPAVGLFEAKNACRDLRALCRSHGDNWSVFALCVDNQGHFVADFSYDAFDHFTPLQRRLWRGRYLK